MKKKETRSPINNLPVHMPGQSGREFVMDKILIDQCLPWMIAVGFAFYIAFMEWIRLWSKAAPAPKTYTTLAMIVLGLAVWKIRKAIKIGKQYSLGALGEEAVGQFLDEKLRPVGYHVLHDIPGSGFNLDHVVVGPTGIFCIETKTHSKPAKGECKVKYDGEKITVNGYTPDRDPVVQAKSQANWLRDTLQQSTGRQLFVQPVVLYPGWFVEQTVKNAPVWVLNEKAALTFIRNANSNRLSPEDISLVTFHLKRFIISANK